MGSDPNAIILLRISGVDRELYEKYLKDKDVESEFTIENENFIISRANNSYHINGREDDLIIWAWLSNGWGDCVPFSNAMKLRDLLLLERDEFQKLYGLKKTQIEITANFW
jgi:hypothetical protein